MNKYLFGALMGTVGLVSGAFGGFFFCKKRLDARYDREIKERVDEEIKILRAENEKLWDETLRKRESEKVEQADRKVLEGEMPVGENIVSNRVTVSPTPYHKMVVAADSIQSEGAVEHVTEPIGISKKDFEDAPPGSTIMCWTYSIPSNLMLNENDEPLDDWEKFVDAREIFDILSDHVIDSGSVPEYVYFLSHDSYYVEVEFSHRLIEDYQYHMDEGEG